MTSDQQSELGRQIAVLQEEAEDLRASAALWRALYEQAIRRRAELEGQTANKRAGDSFVAFD